MSHHLDILPEKKHCGCGCQDDSTSRKELDALIEKYKQLCEETQRARDIIVEKAISIEGFATEVKATENKNEILAALPQEATEEEIDNIEL